METNIHISQIDRFFSPTKEIETNYKRTKIVNHSHFSINEASICHKISKIPYYSIFFSILEDYEVLNISQMTDHIIEKLNPDENIKYYLFSYSDKDSIDLSDYLYNANHIKKFILDMINHFQHLLYSLHLLNENDICFFDISPKNIIFLNNNRENPVLSDFKFSLQLNRLDYTYISHILHKLDDYTYQPFEVHLLFYFIKHNMVTISYSFIEEFCEEFVDSLSIMRLFSEQYKKSYKEQCIEMMRRYINVPRKQIIDDILERNNKWDVYGISMIYLHIFGCISRIFSLKGTFISKIVVELIKNLHPNSDKRMSLEETLIMFDKYLNEQTEWKFVENLDNKKLAHLFDELEK